MSIIEKQLGQARITATGDTLIYTVPTGVRTIVKEMYIVNNDSTAHRVLIYHDDSGAVAALTNIIYSNASMPADSSAGKDNMYVAMKAGGVLRANVTTATPDVTITFYGAEIALS